MYTAIVVFVDRLSKMVHLAPCYNTLGAQSLAQIFTHDIFSKHGLPRAIVCHSDRGTQFTSTFFQGSGKTPGCETV